MVRELAERLPVLECRGPQDLEVVTATHDSRKAVAGSLFAAIPGTQVDGHRFIVQAIEGGASLVVLSRWPETWPEGVAGFRVEDPRRALALASVALHEHPDAGMQVVALTGTNGKTTTAAILGSIFEAAGLTWGTLGTTGIECRGTQGQVRHSASHTTPEGPELFGWLAKMRADGVEAVALELSSHALDQGRAAGLSLDVGAWSNLSRDHLDYHGTLAAYEEAKARLFTEWLPSWGKPGCWAVLNVDDPTVATYAGGSGGVRCLRVSCDPETLARGGADLGPQGPVEVSIEGLTGSIRIREGLLRLESSLLGRHNLSNALLAGACASVLGIEPRAIERGWSTTRGAPGRLERVTRIDGEGPLVLVDYAHSDEALREVLRTLRPLVQGQLGLVFGCGGDRDAGKRALMGRAAGEGADWVVLTSDNPRSEDPEAILDGAALGLESCSTPYQRQADRAQAIAGAVARARQEDVVVIAGKGHETTQEIGGVLHPFDDRDHARRALEAWA